MSALNTFERATRDLKTTIAVVLGSGQGTVLSDLQQVAAISFADAPGLPPPAVAGHSGTIVAGKLHGTPIVVFQGRVHFYEGHAWDAVAAPVRFADALGIKTLLLTNAAGGIRASLGPGALMIVRDHLFLQRPGAWRGPAPAACPCLAGPRPSPYSAELIDMLMEAGHAAGEEMTAGVYAALTGPCYETPAEIRALRACGADAVGMSTAHEAQTARELGMRCAALSCITNQAAGLGEKPLDHQDVLEVAARARSRLGSVLAAFVRRAA